MKSQNVQCAWSVLIDDRVRVCVGPWRRFKFSVS